MIVWKDPPKLGNPIGQRTSQWDPIIAELQTRPGEWGLIAHDVWVSMAVLLRNRGVETTFRGVKSGKARDMYGRYVGDTRPNSKENR